MTSCLSVVAAYDASMVGVRSPPAGSSSSSSKSQMLIRLCKADMSFCDVALMLACNGQDHVVFAVLCSWTMQVNSACMDG